MFGIGVQELAIVLVIALLVFGPKRLPELARTMGKGLAEFRRASSDLRQSLNFDLENDRRMAPPGEPTRPAQAGDLGPQVDGDATPTGTGTGTAAASQPPGDDRASDGAAASPGDDDATARPTSPVHSGD